MNLSMEGDTKGVPREKGDGRAKYPMMVRVEAEGTIQPTGCRRETEEVGGSLGWYDTSSRPSAARCSQLPRGTVALARRAEASFEDS